MIHAYLFVTANNSVSFRADCTFCLLHYSFGTRFLFELDVQTKKPALYLTLEILIFLQDRDGHGPEFQKHMNRLNKQTGTNITVSGSTLM